MFCSYSLNWLQKMSFVDKPHLPPVSDKIIHLTGQKTRTSWFGNTTRKIYISPVNDHFQIGNKSPNELQLFARGLLVCESPLFFPRSSLVSNFIEWASMAHHAEDKKRPTWHITMRLTRLRFLVMYFFHPHPPPPPPHCGAVFLIWQINKYIIWYLLLLHYLLICWG